MQTQPVFKSWYVCIIDTACIISALIVSFFQDTTKLLWEHLPEILRKVILSCKEVEVIQILLISHFLELILLTRAALCMHVQYSSLQYLFSTAAPSLITLQNELRY